MNKVQKEEEIDLLALLLKGVTVIKANFWLIVTFFVIGTGLGLAYYYSAPKIYKSDMVVSSQILSKPITESLIYNINKHRGENNIEELMRVMNVDEKTASKVTRFSVKSISEVADPDEKERFIITVEVLDPETLPQVQKGLIHYFQNNEYVKMMVAQNVSFMKQMIAKIDAEIEDIQSFKQKLMNGEFFQSAKGNVMFDPTEMNSRIVELTKEKLTLEKDLQLANSIQVIEGFIEFQRPSSPMLSVSIISGSVIGLFFVGILLAFKSIRRVLRMADTAQQSK